MVVASKQAMRERFHHLPGRLHYRKAMDIRAAMLRLCQNLVQTLQAIVRPVLRHMLVRILLARQRWGRGMAIKVDITLLGMSCIILRRNN
jgi:hypothetical protein